MADNSAGSKKNNSSVKQLFEKIKMYHIGFLALLCGGGFTCYLFHKILTTFLSKEITSTTPIFLNTIMLLAPVIVIAIFVWGIIKIIDLSE